MRTSHVVVAVLLLFLTLCSCVTGAMPAPANATAKRQASTGTNTARRTMANSVGMELVYIGPGEFFMGVMSRQAVAAKHGGGAGEYAHEEPLHSVEISEGFWMGQTEVTRGQFRRFVAATGYQTTAEVRGYAGGFTKDGWKWVNGLNWRAPGIEQTDEHPVVQVSWFDATAFCEWLSEQEQRRYVLPTEAQWEYACQAGRETAYCWGDTLQGGREYANMADTSTQRWIRGYRDMTIETCPWDDGYPTTAPVASFKPNAWGLYDLHGNACEWCRDWYASDYYQHSDGLDPTGPALGGHRVLRGGSWVRHPRVCRTTSRHSIIPTFRSVGRGFRVVLCTSSGDPNAPTSP